MLKVYRTPDGITWQYEEGEQPESAVEVVPEKEKAPARRRPAKKAKDEQ